MSNGYTESKTVPAESAHIQGELLVGMDRDHLFNVRLGFRWIDLGPDADFFDRGGGSQGPDQAAPELLQTTCQERSGGREAQLGSDDQISHEWIVTL